jgi:heat shock protein HspQ
VTKSKYDVGDEILIAAKIVQDDESYLPLEVKIPSGDTIWIMEEDVSSVTKKVIDLSVGDYVTSEEYPTLGAGKIVNIDRSTVPYEVLYSDGSKHWNSRPKLTKVEQPKLKVGDYVTVIDNESEGIGKIFRQYCGNFYVRFKSEHVNIVSLERLNRAETPSDPTLGELKFKIGDRVTHKNYPTLGAGIVVFIDNSGVPYQIKFDDNETKWGVVSSLEYAPVSQFKIGDYVTSSEHASHGIGRIRIQKPGSVFYVEFEHAYRNCISSDLTPATIPDFKIGVYVKSLSYPHRGVGKIVDTDETFDGFNVRFGSSSYWHSFNEMEIVSAPVDHKFAVGDKVLHAVKGVEWGVGTVYGIRDEKYLGYEYETATDTGHILDESGPIYDVRYDGNKEWASPERLLIKAKGI